jgi:hypothetical protein
MSCNKLKYCYKYSAFVKKCFRLLLSYSFSIYINNQIFFIFSKQSVILFYFFICFHLSIEIRRYIKMKQIFIPVFTVMGSLLHLFNIISNITCTRRPGVRADACNSLYPSTVLPSSLMHSRTQPRFSFPFPFLFV